MCRHLCMELLIHICEFAWSHQGYQLCYFVYKWLIWLVKVVNWCIGYIP